LQALLHVKLHKPVAAENNSDPKPDMALKKKTFAEDEIGIFDDAVIYKRGDYWHFRMWLAGEGKYARKSLKTRSRSTAIDKGKDFYLECSPSAPVSQIYGCDLRRVLVSSL
jgi:hypothetical protein